VDGVLINTVQFTSTVSSRFWGSSISLLLEPDTQDSEWNDCMDD
jgi:hypothetical protein